MAYAYQFNPVSMNATQYTECIARLEAAGAGDPPGAVGQGYRSTGEVDHADDMGLASECEDAVRGLEPLHRPVTQRGVVAPDPERVPVELSRLLG